VVELRPGTLRGNHFHRRKAETVYLVSGEMNVLVKDPENATRETIPLKAGDVLTIPAGIAHVMQPTAAGYAVEISPTRFEPEDTEKHHLL